MRTCPWTTPTRPWLRSPRSSESATSSRSIGEASSPIDRGGPGASRWHREAEWASGRHPGCPLVARRHGSGRDQKEPDGDHAGGKSARTLQGHALPLVFRTRERNSTPGASTAFRYLRVDNSRTWVNLATQGHSTSRENSSAWNIDLPRRHLMAILSSIVTRSSTPPLPAVARLLNDPVSYTHLTLPTILRV